MAATVAGISSCGSTKSAATLTDISGEWDIVEVRGVAVAPIAGQAQPFIDNVSVEYRLDNSGSRYVKLFHNKNYESLLEGEITETGAGIVLRRKMMHLRELFNFKKKKVKPINEEKEE